MTFEIYNLWLKTKHDKLKADVKGHKRNSI